MAVRKNLQSADTREQILAAASQLFTEHGVDNTSLKDIARCAGVSTGTLFYHYASKADLIFDVTNRHFDQLTHQLLAWASEARDLANPRHILKVVLETITQDLTRGKLHHYLIEEAVSSSPSLRARFLQKYQEWRLMLQIGLEPFVGASENQVTAVLVLAAIDGLVIQKLLGIEDISLDRIANSLVEHYALPPASDPSIRETTAQESPYEPC